MRLELLQAGRGLAAVTIVAVHANHRAPVAEWIEIGRHTVEFFFLLSGYIIFHIHSRRDFDLAAFTVARIRRVYPPYLPVATAAGLAYLWLGREVDWVATLTLLPGQTALIPAWTLQRELAFYALAALFFCLRAPLRGAAVWAAAIMIRQTVPVPLGPWEQVFLSHYSLYFVAGMFLASAWTLPDVKIGRTLNMLGNASYSIYLVHLPVMGGLWRIGAPFWMLVAVPVLAGIAYHRWVEQPLVHRLKPPRHAGTKRPARKVDRPTALVLEPD